MSRSDRFLDDESRDNKTGKYSRNDDDRRWAAKDDDRRREDRRSVSSVRSNQSRYDSTVDSRHKRDGRNDTIDKNSRGTQENRNSQQTVRDAFKSGEKEDKLSRSNSSVRSTPTRSGIGIDTNEWEEPSRLSTSIPPPRSRNEHARSSSIASDRSSGATTMATPLSIESHDGFPKPNGPVKRTSKYTNAEHVKSSGDIDEWEDATPLRPGTDDLASTITGISMDGEQTKSLSRESKTGISVRALHRAGFLVDDTPLPGSDQRRKFFDPTEDDDEFDRDFYLSEEGQTSGSEGRNNNHFLGSSEKFQEREEMMAKSRARGDTKIAGMSAKRSQLQVDQAAWEDNRLLQSGVAVMREVATEFDNDEDSRVTLIVHNLKPPFLDGRMSFSMQQSTVATVRDPSSDFATNARNGSTLLRDVREKREQSKMRKRFWELGGSRMGDAMGIARPQEEEEDAKPTAVQVTMS